jgi:predicted ferric reductase
VGITPFHSWLQSLPAAFDREVQFFYTTPEAETGLFAPEVTATARAHPSLQLHLISSRQEGRLTPGQVAAAVA